MSLGNYKKLNAAKTTIIVTILFIALCGFSSIDLSWSGWGSLQSFYIGVFLFIYVLFNIKNIDTDKAIRTIEHLIEEHKDLKEIEESHRKENGELREKVKQLEEENKTLNERNQYLVKYRAKLEKELYESNENYNPVSLEEKIKSLEYGRDNTEQKYFKKEVLEELLNDEHIPHID